ncbi:ABC transporter substrate-binding protein [Enterovirga rhinocerotis]|uniref:Iron(III) transport system substrate-binding protein n=1 Tax=Enterovirga rhinocerotis TaxID=1339210 RepID=A0A4V3DXB6_9HYPH|nr:extracellular solute-binding protein [Enterovirga rhinocerotis]TDR88089.1 iron(III) transport system substrate-binding protein [Enterovirga rhinocerotis]
MRGLALAGLIAMAAGSAAAQDCCPKELVEAAKKEGRVVLYSSVVLDNEQVVAAEFQKKFPGITVDIVRAPGARLFTRIETEAAAGKLTADVVDLTERVLATRIDHLFADYKPPNAADWDRSAMGSPKLWPRTQFVYGLAYNPAIVSPPPEATWKELMNPRFGGKVGLILASSGGSGWTAAMQQRKEFGEDRWREIAKLKPRLFESNGPASSAVVRGEVQVAQLLLATANSLKAQGAPIEVIYPTEGLPAAPGAAAIFKDAPHPNAAKLFLDWSLSREGQNVMVEKLGGMSLLKGTKLPEGAPKDVKVWTPSNEEFAALRDPWIKEWDEIFGYRN